MRTIHEVMERDNALIEDNQRINGEREATG